MIYFQLQYIAKTLNINKDFPLVFKKSIPEPTTLTIRRLTKAELKQAYQADDLLCIAETTEKPTRAIKQWLENKNREPLPKGFANLASTTLNRLATEIEQILEILRWRIGYRSERNPVRFFRSFKWSIDGEKWNIVPDTIRGEIVWGIPFNPITDEVIESVSSLWQSGCEVPLAHELFQEAWSQCDDNPKSSLVLGIASAETGIKHLISKLVPNAAWLIENTQSPPLVKMLKDYLPFLPIRIKYKEKEGFPLPPKWLIESLEKGVNLRNQIVHGHSIKIESKSVREILVVINDLLYLFDLYSGETWASNLLSVEMTKSLK